MLITIHKRVEHCKIKQSENNNCTKYIERTTIKGKEVYRNESKDIYTDLLSF